MVILTNYYDTYRINSNTEDLVIINERILFIIAKDGTIQALSEREQKFLFSLDIIKF